MVATYIQPGASVTSSTSVQPSLGKGARVIGIFADFPKGPDVAVLVRPDQMQTTFGDWSKASSVGWRGPYLAYFSAIQQPSVASLAGIAYLVQRLNVTRASYNALDVSAGALIAFTLQGIGPYAGTAGNRLRAGIITSGTQTDQIWSLPLIGTGLVGTDTYTVTLPGYGTATVNENDSAATVTTKLNAVWGTNAVTVTGTTFIATGGTYTVTAQATGPLHGTLLPNLTVNTAGLTHGTVTSFIPTISTPGVRGVVQEIDIYDTAVSLTTPLVAYKDTSVAGGTYNLNTVASGNPNQAIVNALNGANPTNNINSIIQASLGTSSAIPNAVTISPYGVLSGGLDGQNAPYTSLTQALMQNSLWTQCDFIVTCFDGALVAPTLINHFMDGTAQNDFRKACLGPVAGTTYTTLSTSYITAAIQNDRIAMVGADNFTGPHPYLQTPVQWDGFYLGAILAGLKAKASPEQTCARMPIRGVTSIGPLSGLSQQLTLAQAATLEAQGLVVPIQDPATRTIYFNNTLTAATYADPNNSNNVNLFSQFCTRDCDDSMSRATIGITQPFVLAQLGSGGSLTQVKAAIHQGLGTVAFAYSKINSITVTSDAQGNLLPAINYVARFPIQRVINQNTVSAQ